MKKILLAILCLGWIGSASSQTLGNLISIVPNTAMQGQTLMTTITLPQGSFMIASPPCDIYGIYLEKAGTMIYCNNFMPSWQDIADVEFTIPGNADPGLYNVYYAGAIWDPWFWNCSTIGYWELLNGFEITGTSIIGPATLTHAYVSYNSVTSEINISPEIKSNANDNLFVFDIYGKEILALPLNGKHSIYLNQHLQSGIYFFRIGNYTGKFHLIE